MWLYYNHWEPVEPAKVSFDKCVNNRVLSFFVMASVRTQVAMVASLVS